MYKSLKNILPIIALLLFSTYSNAQKKEQLKMDIDSILAKYQAKVGIAIHNHDYNDSLTVNGDFHFPFQSVYKFHLGIVIMDQVDKGKLSLDQPIKISKEAVTTEMYSPIKDKYPNGVTLPLREVLEYTIAASDNVGCDVLFELLGGPEYVQKYFEDKGYSNLSIKLIEAVQQKEWNRQFENWTTVGSSNQILYDYYTNSKKLLSASSHQFLWDTMRGTTTGPDRLKGDLPKGTVVAHKTGYSGRNRTTGIIAALNDVGVVSLPNGEVYYISVFVTDSEEGEAGSAKIIAEVSAAAWKYFN
ncbi:class A beta-lactamase [Sphingobacterium hotanense]|uniref:class A beta-lactamase n=1 Tax=Sphingobacterium hotanense TaxID=649196 RepID=UPI0021A7B17A|nr:class A beta-lactamase [Sphingobacterium hotanense]MCT1525974.1 class A beta-lactamase [Sphingobacterium hotanense]